MAPHKLAAFYLILLGLGLAIFAYTFANGATAPKLSWVGLSQARLGLYHRASAIKQIRSAAFADPSEPLQGSTAQRLIASIRQGKVTLRQRTHCIHNTYARGCNLPYIELSLGLAFGLSVIALSSAVVLWLGPSRAGTLTGFVIVITLFCAASYRWLEQTQAPVGSLLAKLQTLEVGVYKNIEVAAKPDPNDPAYLEILNARALQSKAYCGLPAFTANCGTTILEMPLSLPFLSSLGCLLSLSFITLATTVRLRLKQLGPVTFPTRDEP